MAWTPYSLLEVLLSLRIWNWLHWHQLKVSSAGSVIGIRYSLSIRSVTYSIIASSIVRDVSNEIWYAVFGEPVSQPVTFNLKGSLQKRWMLELWIQKSLFVQTWNSTYIRCRYLLYLYLGYKLMKWHYISTRVGST